MPNSALHGTAATSSHSVVVIGAGQAGLSVTYALQQRGIRPLVLEKHRIGYAWDQQRWDSFCLVTPNWQCRLPDFPYDGDQPEGFMDKRSIVSFLQRFARHVAGDVREGVAVQRLTPNGRGYRLITSEGEIEAEQIVVATGGYHQTRRHPLAERLPGSILQLDARDYRNPDALPPGPILVVGSGQSGSQIAEDLFLAGRTVHLSVGSAPRSPRRYRGRDVVDWLDRMGYYTMPISEHADPRSVRAKTNHYLTGRDGGREIDLRRRASRECSCTAGSARSRLNTLALQTISASLTRPMQVLPYSQQHRQLDSTGADRGPLEPPYSHAGSQHQSRIQDSISREIRWQP